MKKMEMKSDWMKMTNEADLKMEKVLAGRELGQMKTK